MAEFTEIAKIKARMCNGKIRCTDCALYNENNGYSVGCVALMTDHPEEYERICLEWAKENPELTNKDKLCEVLKEAFGEQIAQTLTPKLACDIFDCDGMECAHCCYADFWNKPYVEPKEGNIINEK